MQVRNDAEYEVELNLKDLLFHLLYRWRSLLVAALIGAIVLCGYQFFSIKSVHDEGKLTKEERQYQIDLQTYRENLSSGRRQVETLTRQLEGQNKYQAESIYFRLDAQSVWTARASYLVKVDPSVLDTLPQGSTIDPADSLLSSYALPLSSATDDELKAAFGTENPSYAAELVLVSTDPTTNTVNVSVKGATRESAEAGLSLVQGKILLLEEKAQEIEKHTLTLTGQQSTQGTDSGLAQAQKDLAKSMEDSQKLLQEAREQVNELENKKEPKEPGMHLLRMGVVGFILGAFLLAAVYLAVFVLRGTLTGGSDLARRYDLPVLGEFERTMSLHGGKGLDKFFQKHELKEQIEDSAVYDRIASLIAEKTDVKNLLLLSTLPEEKLAILQKELSSRLPGLSLEAQGNFLENGEAIPKASAADAVLLAEEKGISKNKAIDSMAKALVLSKANVIGAVIL